MPIELPAYQAQSLRSAIAKRRMDLNHYAIQANQIHWESEVELCYREMNTLASVMKLLEAGLKEEENDVETD